MSISGMPGQIAPAWHTITKEALRAHGLGNAQACDQLFAAALQASVADGHLHLGVAKILYLWGYTLQGREAQLASRLFAASYRVRATLDDGSVAAAAAADTEDIIVVIADFAAHIAAHASLQHVDDGGCFGQLFNCLVSHF